MARNGTAGGFAIFTLMGARFGVFGPAKGAHRSWSAHDSRKMRIRPNWCLTCSRSVKSAASASWPRQIALSSTWRRWIFNSIRRSAGVGALPKVSLVKGFRFGLLAPGKSRIVIDLARAACPAKISAKPIVEGEAAAGSRSNSGPAIPPPLPRWSARPPFRPQARLPAHFRAAGHRP